MRSFTGTQTQIEKVDRRILNKFQATKGLTKELRRDRVKMVDEKRSALFANVGKDLLKQAQIEKQEERLHPKHAASEFNIESEIIGLSNFQKPVFNIKTEDMIKRQKESRRDRHIKTNIDFEQWVEKLQIDIDEGYEQIKSDVVDYFKFSDIEIEEYFAAMTDEHLLSREKEILQEMKDMIQQHESKRTERVQGLDKRLDNQETERQQNILFFCDNLQQQLKDIAFILEPQVIIFVEEKRKQFELEMQENLEKNAEYVKEINEKQLETFGKFEEIRQEVEKRWRQLRHTEALDQFLEDIKLMEYVNPDYRKELYIDWKIKTKDIFDRRVYFLNKLNKCEIMYLTKAIVDKWIEDVKNYNDKAQEVYDQCFNNLMKESEMADQHAKERLNVLQERLEYVGHLEGEELQTLLNEQCVIIVTKLHEDARELMMKAIKYVEDADLKTNELILNVGRWFSKIGKSNDEHKVNQQKLNFEYQIQQATVEDKNDENLENLNEQFAEIKQQLKTALHHPKLNEVLDISFAKIDEIETEYRDIHDKKIEIVEKHPSMIDQLYRQYEQNQVKFFELLPEEKKEEIEQRNLERAQQEVQKIMEKEEKEKAAEEERQANEQAAKKGGKKPPPKKVDPKKQQAEFEQRQKELLEQVGVQPVETFETPMKQIFVIAFSMEEIAKKMYIIQEEEEELTEEQIKEKEAKEQQEELEKKQKEEEERLQKEQEEADKKKGGKPAKKPASNPKIKSGNKIEEPPEEQKQEEEEEKPVIPVDFIDEPPTDPEGIEILDKDVIIKVDVILDVLNLCQQKLFKYLGSRLKDSQEEAKLQDNDFIENSILILDERLKAHYPLKGKVEVDIFQVRAAQITNHKKRYERHARNAIDKIDLQTEHFNYLLENGLQDTKEYEQDQKLCIERLPTGHTLAKLQGILNTARENSFKFQQKIEDNIDSLNVLAEDEVQFLLDKNIEFIKESRLFENGGEYDPQEVEWYKEMLKEIDQQLEDQRTKRKQRVEEIQEHMKNKRAELLQEFEKQYLITIEELSAKDGTGKKFGRPRRLAQERSREEMNKCEKSQETIQNFLDQIRDLYQEYLKTSQNPSQYLSEKELFSKRVKEVLMALRSCMGRYSKHIEAIKPDAKLIEMKRISYNEEKWDLNLDAEEVEKDTQRQEDELEYLGPLFYQKDNKNYIEWVNDIEKQVIGEAQKLYVGDKAKFLTGNDKIPDYLRTYLEGMKKKATEFKIQCIRDLRNFCDELSELTPQISEMIIQSVNKRFLAKIQYGSEILTNEFQEIKYTNDNMKNQHMFELRPNMSNPCIKDELEALLEKEQSRLEKYVDKIEEYKQLNIEIQFNQSNLFFKALLHNFEFLLTLYDSLILWEDFVKLPGDEDIQKKHENIKVLLRMQQQGAVIDTSSERSLSKTWVGEIIQSFMIDEKKIEYELSENIEEVQDPKKKGGDKKGGKKDAKKDAKKAGKGDKQNNAEEEEEDELEKKTKEIKSFKTYRQKSASHNKQKCFQEFKYNFDEQVHNIKESFEQCKYLEQKFLFKWNQTRKQLETAQQE